MLLPKTLKEFPSSPLGAHDVIAKMSQCRSEPQSMEERVARLEAERDVRDFVYNFAYLFDAKDLEGLMGIYAEDCVLVNSSGTYEGFEAIRRIQEHDLPGTEISFHHLGNLRVVLDGTATVAWASSYMYNLAIREEEPYGTVATLLFRLVRDQADRPWRATACRIAIDSRHSLRPKEMKIIPNKLASRPETSADLVGRFPRFPSGHSISPIEDKS